MKSANVPEPVSMRWTRFSTFLLSAAGVYHLHRAWTLAITIDEAFTANSFASAPWLELLTTYDANHHILHTILCKLSLSAFGWSELALRLPSLLGGFVWLYLVHRLAKRLFGESPLHLVLCGWLAFHPALLDWFSLARGYGLALTFMLAAIHELAGPLPRLVRASVWLGLSVASNLIFAIPAAALVLAWTATRRAWTRLPDLAVPGAAVAFVITILPLSRASGTNFYFGASTLPNSLDSLLAIPHFQALTPLFMLAAPAVLLAALWFGRRDETLRFFAWSLALCILATAAMRIAGMPYPLGRTGVHLVALWILCLLQLASLSRFHWTWAVAIAPVFAFLFAAPIGYYPAWRYDSSNRAVMERIAASGVAAPRVAAHFTLVWGLEFYRRMPAFRHIAPVTGLDTAAKAQFLVVRTDESKPKPPPGATPILRDYVSGVVLYQR
jgi:hypothetical protein